MATITTETIIKEWYDAWNSHDGEKVSRFYTDDCIYEDMGSGRVYRGPQEVGASVEDMTTSFPDFKLEAKQSINTGNWSASEWVLTGTFAHSNIPNMPATGKSFSVRGASVCELRDSKIRRHSDYWNMATFLQQVGLMPGAPAK
jgi:steroid delta-isomerase-like uncharacterized protein